MGFPLSPALVAAQYGNAAPGAAEAWREWFERLGARADARLGSGDYPLFAVKQA